MSLHYLIDLEINVSESKEPQTSSHRKKTPTAIMVNSRYGSNISGNIEHI